MTITLITPALLTPPHRVSHPEKLAELAERFVERGWGENQEALVGYPIDGSIQLLSGTHRHGAALLAGLEAIPVVVRAREEVEAAFGDLGAWRGIMATVWVTIT
jgi:ParB-like chromosome segregation protein Spo0J